MGKLICFVLLMVLMLPGYSRATGEIGSIKTFKGEVFIVRGGTALPAEEGAAVFQDDLLRTGSNGALGVILKDDTTLSLGPDSELSLQEYVFEPKENRFSVVLRVLKGTFVYMSGVIGKLAPDSIRLETPDSTIAVRGTRLMIKVGN